MTFTSRLLYYEAVLDWSASERAAIEGVLAKHPIESGRCARAAGAIYPMAQRLDPNARLLELKPKSPARYVLCRRRGVPPFWHHVLVGAHAHGVDALAGADGVPLADYPQEFWEYAADLVMRAIEPEDLDPL